MINENTAGTTVIDLPANENPKKSWRQWLIGRPLQTADAPKQTIGKIGRLGSICLRCAFIHCVRHPGDHDHPGSRAAGGMRYVFPISIAIVMLMAIVTISYEQTIHAYPGGGGAYIVARDNLGELPAQTAGAALLTDYILTVAVSISSGVAQIVSAFPVLLPYRVVIAVALVMFIMIINLRGVKESGVLFAIPTYFFLCRHGDYSWNRLVAVISVGTWE